MIAREVDTVFSKGDGLVEGNLTDGTDAIVGLGATGAVVEPPAFAKAELLAFFGKEKGIPAVVGGTREIRESVGEGDVAIEKRVVKRAQSFGSNGAAFFEKVREMELALNSEGGGLWS